MKYQIIIFSLIILSGCRPEQETTQFNVTLAPQAGETVEASTKEDNPILIKYKVEDEENSMELTFDLVEKPKHGILKDCKYLSKKEWQCLYIPNENFFGEDLLVFKKRDGDFEAENKSYMKIKILPVPDAPKAGDNQVFTLMENSKVTFKVNNGTDPDSKQELLKYSVTVGPENGELVNCFEKANPTECTFIPSAEYFGEDVFSYSVDDVESKLNEKSSLAHVSFNVIKEWIPVSGVVNIKIEDRKSNALIVFTIDNSGSMSPYINHMKQSVLNFVDDIAKRGFKATIAFITSDQIKNKTYKDQYSYTKPHPKFPEAANSYLKSWKRIPHPDAVKIFEIDAYDAAWNEETKNTILDTRTNIQTFLNELPEGSDDERLLCSTVRFLESDYAKDKSFVGVFSIANEDDALNAKTLSKAFTDCHKETTREKTPLASCKETIACVEGEEGCTPKWIYNYTKTKLNPVAAKFKGTCEKDIPNMVEQNQPWRRGVQKIEKFKTVFDNICVPEDEVIQTWRKGSVDVPLKKKEYYKECKEEWKVVETWRKGDYKKANYKTEKYTECKLDWETLDNPNGCRELSRQVISGYTPIVKDEKGSCTALSEEAKVSWTSCNDYQNQVNDGCKTLSKYVDNGTRTDNKDEEGTCAELVTQGVTWNSCEEYQNLIDDGCSDIPRQVTDGFRDEDRNEKGQCSELEDSVRSTWTTCEDYSKTINVAEGTKKDYYDCNSSGGSSCSDHKNFFYGDTCQLVSEAKYNPPTLTPNQIKNSSVEKTCKEVTGYDVCESITWAGSKVITKTEGCALGSEKLTYHKFTVEGAPVQTLANSVANKLNTGFVKSVYVSVMNDLTLNTAALEKAASKKLPLPSAACERYIERREKFKGMVDGIQFGEVVKLLASQGSAYSICSPDRYSSEKLDYLVSDAQLDFEISENKIYDLLETTQIKIIYASGESKVLTPIEYKYSEGHVTLVDPLLGKNLVEMQISYKAFKK